MNLSKTLKGSPLSKLMSKLIKNSVEGGLELIKYGRCIFLKLLATHGLVGFLQLYSCLLDVVHQDTGLGELGIILSRI